MLIIIYLMLMVLACAFMAGASIVSGRDDD